MKVIRIISLILVVLLVFTANLPVLALTTEQKKQLYDDCILQLENWLESDHDVAELSGVYDALTQLAGYDQSKFLSYFVDVLIRIEKGEFDSMIDFYLSMMEDNESFSAFLSETLECSVEMLKNYAAARQFEQEGKTVEAVENYKKCLSFYDGADRYERLAKEAFGDHYDNGMKLMAADDLVGAYREFSQAYGIEYSAERMMYIEKRLGYDPLHEHDWQPASKTAPKACKVCGLTEGKALVSPTYSGDPWEPGEYVTFGHYPQNSEGTENVPIEWLVLDVQDNHALLISRYGLDSLPYNTEHTGVTWENCTLRVWLNDDFLEKAFTQTETQAILITTVNNNESQGYWDTDGGRNTQDKIFLLSLAETDRLFEGYDARMCAPTDYAIAQDGMADSKFSKDGRSTGYWWLRSPGSKASNVAIVRSNGALGYYKGVDSTNMIVRPVLWLDLGAGID